MTVFSSPPSLGAVLAAPGADGVDSPAWARGRRITLLIVAMLLMGALDLACTLTYMRTSGMIELNPLARLMIAVGDERQLILFKLLMMMLSAGALYFARWHRRAEVCAWMCAAGLLALVLHWTNYNRSISQYTNDVAVLALSDDQTVPEWVMLEPGRSSNAPRVQPVRSAAN
ncbi:MAG: DUF5658 family protein [Planctomycetota bacterium]|nr:DUF5658 family protein [Planctomycetota bacterium]